MKTPLIALGTWVKRPLLSLFMLLVMLSLANQAMAAAPVITSPASGSTLPSVAVGQSMSIPISSTGGALPLDRWVECDANDPDYDGVTPCLPSGLILDPSPGSATTTLHGAPTTAGSYTFSITLNDGLNQGGVATYTLLVTSGATPTLTSVSPNTGTTAGATAVTLSGTNLTGATAVSFGGTAATGFSVSNASTITATTPAHAAGAVNVMVTTPSGTATLTNAYTYAVPAPTVGPVSATVAANSSSNPITLSLSGGTATSVAVSTAATHGTATATGTSITYTPTAGYSGSDTFAYTATNASGTSSPATVTLTISAPTLAITPTTVPNGTQGTAYSTTLTASGGTAPYTYAITSGSLPAGLSLNTSNGSISGTPSASGNTNLTVTATDANSATGSRAYTLTIDAQAPVANAVSATVVANSSSNPITLNITGGTATSVAVSTAATHGTATATGTSITYTPTAGYSGSDTFAYTATNASGTSSPATVSLTVSAPTLAITPTTVPNGTQGTAYSTTLTASGGTAPYTYAITSGSLPAGLSLNTSNGSISGTPSASGNTNLTVTATDANSATGSRAYTLTIDAQAPVANAVSATVVANSSSNPITLNITGGTAASVAVATAAAHGTATATGTSITYTPTPGYSGSDTFTYTATNASGTSSPATVSLTVSAPTLVIAPASFSSGTVGTAYSTILSTSGGTAPYSYNITSGSLPSGLNLNPLTGAISGTPTASGTSNLTITSTDNNGVTGNKAYSLQINAQAPVANAVSATLAANSSSNPITLSLSGGAATSVAVSTAATHGTATATGTSITYTPAPGYSGSDTFAYTATNASGTSSPATVTLTINAPTLVITPASFSNGTVGTPYSTTLSTSGGAVPYAYSITSGSLPSGLSLNTLTGAISGTPTASGTSNLTLTSTDNNGATGSKAYTLQINAQVPIANAVSATVAANSSANSITLSLSGGAAASVAVATAATHGTATATGTGITYTPAPGYSGNDTFAYTATNASGTSNPATVTLTVSAPTLSINPASLGAGTSGTPYSTTLSTSGGAAPYTYSITSGSLPAGLSLNASTGTISGTPSASGTSNLTLTSTDNNGATGSKAYTLQINAQVPVANAVSATVAANSSTNPITLSISGGTATSVTVSTAATHGTATATGTGITYTPAPGYSGNDTFAYTATNTSGTSSPATVTLTVSAPTLSINPASLGAGTSGTAYSAVLSSSGGSAPYTYSITSGSLPAGLSLNASTGTISGTPTASGTSNLTLTSTDSNGATGSRAYSISISAVPISVPASSQILSAGEEAIVDLTQGATGGPFTQVILGTVSPASAGRAMMRGPFSMRFVPSAAFAGTAIISFRLHNGTGSSAASTVSFIVQPRPDPTKDGEVIGLLNAQSRSAERFASTQMDNFNHRLEQLHQMRCDRNSFNASLRKDGSDLPLGEMAKAIEQQLGSSANQTEQQKREAASAAQNGECQQQALAFWSDGFVNNGSTHARGARDNSFTTMGLSAGADYRLSPTVIAGIGIGYGTDRSEIGDHKTRSDADAIGIATYLSLNPASQFYLDGLLGYNRISFDSRRYITGSANDYARGSRDADQLFASLTASYEYRQGQLSLTPYGRFNASTTRLDAFSENGGGIYGLSYEEQRQQNFTSYLGLRTGYDLMTRVGVVTPKVGLAWGHNFSTHSDYKMRYTDQGDEGILYRLKPDAQDSDFASLDMGMDFNLGRAWQLGFSYKTALGSDERNDSFRLGLNGKF
ncbi:putative Ig domain-containing protein [Pseudomonas sessilinigenes]|uniref:Autotransporter domain-containing protein n=1 Tax=Pseudomonas sessilinigenes TaxID=658629 RepID=A0ABX8ML45_9PSED|nr:putative Ig domain-containing protein [Pseudomonas sessilinigenes]AZC27154.1 Fibronectin type III domain protein [Pseudomonas sessilinigenes]QXH38906.1 autotransporter domain-containing protein [Pseudomonas sessilinigenes]